MCTLLEFSNKALEKRKTNQQEVNFNIITVIKNSDKTRTTGIHLPCGYTASQTEINDNYFILPTTQRRSCSGTTETAARLN